MNLTSSEAYVDKFQQVLRVRIANHFANPLMWVKIVAFLLLWVLSLAFIFHASSSFSLLLFAYIVHGFASLAVIFNIGHDAVHQAISSRAWVNHFLGYSFNLVGSNRYSWFLKHNLGHHCHTNVEGKDVDIETAPLFRVSPFAPLKQYYRYQHLYIFAVYCMLSLALIFIVDFKVLINSKDSRSSRIREWIVLVLSKSAYLFLLIILPSVLLPVDKTDIILCFFLMHCVVGLSISLVLLPSHFIEHAEYFRSSADAPANWSEHQLRTTVDIIPESKVANFLLGGLNTNVVHHIFPVVCHVHLVELTAIVKETAREFHLPYQSYSLYQALRLHFSYLKKMGRSNIANSK
jgi:linoleoyl-CoA desaturase